MRPWAFGLAVTLSLCAHASAQTLQQSPPQQSQPPSPAQTPPAGPTSPRCEAAALAYLIGRPKSEIPVPVDPSHRRVACATCPVSQDYRPDRTDILYDANTGLITAVTCG
ncbi:MAG: peptidase inhibitor I78, partial [Caulobacteraceae bacterium]|nr:peptidase inhibitor I78 [Caulobacteraceae bacterium]